MRKPILRLSMILTFCFVAPTSFAACRSTSDAECDPACGASEYCCLGSCRALGSVCGPDAPDASDGDGDGDGAVSQDSAVVDAAPVDPCAPRNGVVTSSASRDAVTMVACLTTVAGNTFDCSAFGAVCVEQQQQSSDGPMTKSACAPAGSTLCDPFTQPSPTECRGTELWLCDTAFVPPPGTDIPKGLFPSDIRTWTESYDCTVQLNRADATCVVADGGARCVAP